LLEREREREVTTSDGLRTKKKRSHYDKLKKKAVIKRKIKTRKIRKLKKKYKSIQEQERERKVTTSDGLGTKKKRSHYDKLKKQLLKEK
jgi:hypothetical protein